MADVEDDITNNVFASLMPNLFNRLEHCDDIVSEHEFEKIHRLLNLARSEGDVINESSFISQLSDEKPQEEVKNMPAHRQDDEKAQGGVKKNPSLLIKSDSAGGKENDSPNNPPQRNKLSRHERSSRVTTHRKPFVVDIRRFGSILHNNALGKCEKPQDVHAFWEAADERDASEAIMDKLRGRFEKKAVSGTTSLRRLGVRRKNSQRTTTHLRRFAVELPSCAEQVKLLDQDRLEEEEDATEESSFTFLSNPEFRILNQTHQQKDAKKQLQRSQQSNALNAINPAMEIPLPDEVSNQPEDLDILSDGKSSVLNVPDNGQSSVGVPDTTALKGETSNSKKQSQFSKMVDAAHTENAVDLVNEDRVVVENNDAASESEMKATPYNRNIASGRIPFTSPTPPSNPLTIFGLRKETVVEDMSKRKLDFDDNMDLPALYGDWTAELDLPASVTQNAPCLQIFSTRAGPPSTSVEEGTLESGEALLPEALVPSEATNSIEKMAVKPPKPTMKRKKPIDNRRNSLEGAGTSWVEGQRRSTRIKSRPLEWWRGERFLLGRVHKSLATVIGIKYSSPPPYWPKRGARPPKFKVESFVSEEHAQYVQFAALC